MNTRRWSCPDTHRYQAGNLTWDDFPTRSAEFARTLQRAREIAQSDLRALLQGETGTGKNFLARAIHNASRRARAPFVEVNLAGLPREMAYGELFGYRAGAFTGAHHARKGAFEQAHGGTLFLDEVGDLPLDLQPLLLRAIAQRKFTPLGEDDRVVDVRIIAATHQDLGRLVSERRFREDLRYRVEDLVLRVPPLRARREDVHDLFLAQLAEAGRADLARKDAFEPDAWSFLERHSWPGNLRDLRAAAHRVAVHTKGRLVAVADFAVEPASIEPVSTERVLPRPEDILPADEVLRDYVVQAVRATGGNFKEAARRLRLARNTVRRRWREAHPA